MNTQEWITKYRNQKRGWDAVLWRLVEKHFNKLINYLEEINLPIRFDRDETLVKMFFLIQKIIIMSGWKENTYLEINPPVSVNLKEREKRKAKLKKEITEDLIQDMFFMANIISGQVINLKELEKYAKQAEKFIGKKVKPTKVEIYKNIRTIKEALEKKFATSSQIASWTNAVRTYLMEQKIPQTKKKVKSLTQTTLNYFKKNPN